jgi:linoleoyl-CoA desaturase
LAPRVREICARYGVNYNSAGLFRQYAMVLRRIVKYALPVERRPRVSTQLA